MMVRVCEAGRYDECGPFADADIDVATNQSLLMSSASGRHSQNSCSSLFMCC